MEFPCFVETDVVILYVVCWTKLYSFIRVRPHSIKPPEVPHPSMYEVCSRPHGAPKFTSTFKRRSDFLPQLVNSGAMAV